jgi:hypothetical protein
MYLSLAILTKMFIDLCCHYYSYTCESFMLNLLVYIVPRLTGHIMHGNICVTIALYVTYYNDTYVTGSITTLVT